MSFVEDLFRLDGKVAVVIGGGGVLAGAMAEGLAKAGAKVAIVDLSLENAEKKADEIRKKIGTEAIAVQADASSKQALEDAKSKVVEEWGQVDVLLNAPGINSATPFLEISEDEWHKILDVNLKSIFLASQIFGRQMLAQGHGGSIINISSASSGPPLTKVFTYGVSKAAINNVTQFLAKEWAEQKIRVNAIAPGFFPAEQNRKVLTEDRINSIFKHTPMNRFGEAEELIGAVVWLSSEKASSFVTGSIVRVDGGFTAMTI
jgi:NAD(P)-dependent dehydrogenase (short-subunit alcohol dehydrogenase family)